MTERKHRGEWLLAARAAPAAATVRHANAREQSVSGASLPPCPPPALPPLGSPYAVPPALLSSSRWELD